MIAEIIDAGIEFVSEEIVNEHIKTASVNEEDLASIKERANKKELSQEDEEWIIAACTTKSNSWFKSVSNMETLVRDVIAKSPKNLKKEFKDQVKAIFNWALDG